MAQRRQFPQTMGSEQGFQGENATGMPKRRSQRPSPPQVPSPAQTFKPLPSPDPEALAQAMGQPDADQGGLQQFLMTLLGRR